jgi:hypothetical protein
MPGLTAEFDQTFKELTTFLKLLHHIELEEMLPNAFYEASTILIQNPDKDRIKKKAIDHILQ